MDVPPQQRTDRDWSWSSGERVLFGLIGGAVAVGALWGTGVTLFVLGLALDCAGPSGGPSEIAEGMAMGSAFGVGSGLIWLTAASMLRIASGRRWLRRRSWLAVSAVIAAVSMTFMGVALSVQPPPSDTCRPFDLD